MDVISDILSVTSDIVVVFSSAHVVEVMSSVCGNIDRVAVRDQLPRRDTRHT